MYLFEKKELMNVRQINCIGFMAVQSVSDIIAKRGNKKSNTKFNVTVRDLARLLHYVLVQDMIQR